MLPRSTHTRSDGESVKGRIGGRTHQISRLIGRSLRAVVDLSALGENTVVLDCDVLQADGGTRTAAITGAYVALADAISWAKGEGLVAEKAEALIGSVAAISVGIVDGQPALDLCYDEDVSAETDMNVVSTGDGRFVEVQGTAEGNAVRSQGTGCADRSRNWWMCRTHSAAAGRTRTVTQRLVLATRNEHKVAELRRILDEAGLGVVLVGVDGLSGIPDVAETGTTFAENALLKARAVAEATESPAVADDSGLCVDVLGGMPGIFSRTVGGATWRRCGEPCAGLGAARRRSRRTTGRAVRLCCGCRRAQGALNMSSRVDLPVG